MDMRRELNVKSLLWHRFNALHMLFMVMVCLFGGCIMTVILFPWS